MKMNMRRVKQEVGGCCVLCSVVLTIVLFAAYAFVFPVVVTVDEAALGRLALAAGSNGTASLSYDISFAVAVRNPNWAMWARLTAAAGPLLGELRFRGVPFARGSLAAPGAGRDRICARRTEVFRVSAANAGVVVALGGDGVAEFVRESAAGAFELELVVAGEVKYQAHLRRSRFRKSCPLKLSPSPSMSMAGLARVRCT